LIKRIKHICDIGCYSKCHAGNIQLEKLSFIYGENCYGKSTLCDIMRSLADDNPTYITDRKTIPAIENGDQRVQLSILHPDSTQETSVNFRNGSWEPKLTGVLNLEVFDSDFIYRNVFTGLTIQRENYENITRFVLGDNGVQAAERISKMKASLRELNGRLRNLESGVFRDISSLPDFLQLDISEDPTTLEQAINKRIINIDADQELLRDLDSVLSRPIPSFCESPPNIDKLYSDVETALAKTFKQIHEDAESKLNDHLENQTKNIKQSRRWVQEGIALIKSDGCPFCGQTLSQKAKDLINAYQEVFDESYGKHTTETMAILQDAYDVFKEVTLAGLKTHVEHNQNAYQRYGEMKKVSCVLQKIEAADGLTSTLIAECEKWANIHKKMTESLTKSISLKKENIHINVGSWVDVSDTKKISEIASLVGDYNKCLQPVIDAINQFRGELDRSIIEDRIVGNNEELTLLKRMALRIDLTNACSEYLNIIRYKKMITDALMRLEDELDREQSNFLGEYYEAINSVYSSLGSKRFSIDIERSKRGYMPTIQLRFTFNDEPITQDNFRAVFSESDKRALAFAVFWARIETLQSTELARTIIVLDDPVTSFDENRISKTIHLIEAKLPSLRQAIILTHYRSYLKSLLTRSDGLEGGQSIAILFQDTESTKITTADPLDFTETPHQQAFIHITRFVNREHQEDVCKDLRIFLETEIRSRYRRAIHLNNLHKTNLKGLLEALVTLGEMDETSKGRADQFRRTLNPGHHLWTSNSHEDKIGLAEDLLDFIYKAL